MKFLSLGRPIIFLFVTLSAFGLYSNAEWATLTRYNMLRSISYSLSDWNIYSPIPTVNLSEAFRESLASDFNLRSVVPVLTEKPPFRGTTFYIGERGPEGKTEFLFATSAHLENKGAYAVQLEIDGVSKEVALKKKALFSSVFSDIAIFAVDQPGASRESLDHIKTMEPFSLIGTGLHEVLSEAFDKEVLVAGRAKLGYVDYVINHFPDIWKDSFGLYWNWMDVENPDTPMKRELLENGATEESIGSGDVFVVMPATVLGHGLTRTILDPDGAPTFKKALEEKVETEAFAEAGEPGDDEGPASWRVASLGLDCLLMGRMSGSPVIVRYLNPDGEYKLGVAGLGWTGSNPKPVDKVALNEAVFEAKNVFPEIFWGKNDPRIAEFQEELLSQGLSQSQILEMPEPKKRSYLLDENFVATSYASSSEAVFSMMAKYLDPDQMEYSKGEVNTSLMDVSEENTEVLKDLFVNGFIIDPEFQ